jgi:hypothetical protein
MSSELPNAARAGRGARISSWISTGSMLVILLLVTTGKSSGAGGTARGTLLHVAILLMVASFVMQAIGAWRLGNRWPARVAPMSFAVGVALLELGSLGALQQWSTVLTDAGFIVLLAGVLVSGIDIVTMFRSPPLKS